MAQEKPELSLANQKTTLREGRWGGPPENQGKQRARPSQANKTKRKESIRRRLERKFMARPGHV